MLIILIGPPGSGKGTQARFLSKELGLPHFSLGDAFRDEINQQTAQGRIFNEYISVGKLVPVELVNKLIGNYFHLEQYRNGCILDGYPRSIEQAKYLQEITQQTINVIFFEISTDDITKRILGRMTCGNCGKGYNIYYHKPIVENTCDDCHFNTFTYRKDDNEKVLEERVKIYISETHKLVEYYRMHCKNFYNINASKSQGEVTKELQDLIKLI